MENELPASLYSSHFFYALLPRLVADEAELPCFLLNWQSHTHVHSDMGLTCWPLWQGLSCQQIQSSEGTPNGDILPTVCSWVFLLGGSEWNEIGLGGFIFSHGWVLVISTGRQDHVMLSMLVFLAELTVHGPQCSIHALVNSCGAGGSSNGYRVQQSGVSLPI